MSLRQWIPHQQPGNNKKSKKKKKSRRIKPTDNHNLLPILLLHRRKTVLQVSQRRLLIVERIVRHGLHVEIRARQRALLQYGVVPVLLRLPFPSIVQVQHQLGLRAQRAVLNARGRRIQQAREVVRAAGFKGLARGEERAGGDFDA